MDDQNRQQDNMVGPGRQGQSQGQTTGRQWQDAEEPPETERGGSPATHSSSRTNEEQDGGDSKE
jgi:hypothetical protein